MPGANRSKDPIQVVVDRGDRGCRVGLSEQQVDHQAVDHGEQTDRLQSRITVGGTDLLGDELAKPPTVPGLRRRDLYRLRDAGEVYELSRGVYRKADAPETAHLDLLAVTRRAPRAVVCLVSALALHELTDEIPSVVQIAVPRGTYRPQIDYPMTEVSEFDVATFQLGREDMEAAPGEWISVYGPARSVVDAMRIRSRVGEPLALRSLRRYLSRRQSQPSELLTIARELDVEGPVRSAVQAVLS